MFVDSDNTFIPGCLLIHLYIIIEHRCQSLKRRNNRASTMLNDVFKMKEEKNNIIEILRCQFSLNLVGLFAYFFRTFPPRMLFLEEEHRNYTI